jgi:glycosyltransferase involved in cell wall biosynthesis
MRRNGRRNIVSAPDRLQVLFLAHAYPRFAGDPVGSFIHNLAVALRDEGVDAVVVAPSAPGVPAHDVIDGIPVHRFRYAPRRFETLAYTGTMSAQVSAGLLGKGMLAAFLVAGWWVSVRVARRMQSRVVHAHWWFPGGLVALLLRRRLGVPYVVTLHGSDIRLASQSPLGQRLFRAVARRSAAMTAVSSWLARGAQSIAPETPVAVAPMPVLTDLFFPGDGREPDRLLFVGKLSAQKGLDRLLRAVAVMREPARITVVGAGRVADAHFRELAETLGLASRVEWLPLLSQQELAIQYRRAALHVVPALDEGLGLTAVEALLSETPVVAFKSGGLPDIVLDGRTGLLVPAGDEQALADALDALLSDDGRRAAMGRDGRAHALATFGARAVARRYARLHRDAAMGHRSSATQARSAS